MLLQLFVVLFWFAIVCCMASMLLFVCMASALFCSVLQKIRNCVRDMEQEARGIFTAVEAIHHCRHDDGG